MKSKYITYRDGKLCAPVMELPEEPTLCEGDDCPECEDRFNYYQEDLKQFYSTAVPFEDQEWAKSELLYDPKDGIYLLKPNHPYQVEEYEFEVKWFFFEESGEWKELGFEPSMSNRTEGSPGYFMTQQMAVLVSKEESQEELWKEVASIFYEVLILNKPKKRSEVFDELKSKFTIDTRKS